MTHLKTFWHHLQHISNFGSLLILTMSANIFLSVLGLISGLLAARLLGPVGRGELAAIQTWPNFLAGICMLGVPEALAYFSAREPAQAGRWLTTSILVVLIACLPFVMGGYILMPHLLNAQRTEVIQAAQLYLGLLPIYAGWLPYHVLRGKNDLVAWNILRSIPIISWVIILLLGVGLKLNDPILLSQIYLISLGLLISANFYVIKYRLTGPFQPSPKLIAPMLNYGLPSVLSRIPTTANLRLDQMLMIAWLEPRVLGLYTVAVAWGNTVSPVLGALSETLLPRVAAIHSPVQQARVLAQTIRLGTIISALVALGVALLSPLAVPMLFGSAYLASVPSAILLAFAAGVYALKQLLATGALSLGRPQLVLVAETAGMGITILLLAWLLPRYQLVGAAIASLISYLVVCLVLLGLIKKQSNLTLSELLLPTSADVKLIITKTSAVLRLRSSVP